MAVGAVVALLWMAGAAFAQSTEGSGSAAAQGPIRLRQPAYPVSQRDIDCANPTLASGTGVGNGARQDAYGSGLQSYGYGGTERGDRLDSADGTDGNYNGYGGYTGAYGERQDNGQNRDRTAVRDPGNAPSADERLLSREQIDTFEAYLRKMGLRGIKRFGVELVTPQSRQDCLDGSSVVPPDYVISPGDDLTVNMWGSVDADLRLVVDRSGRISIPRVGAIMVAGVPYSEVPALITRRAERVFKNFQVSVSIGQLRSARVYVTGYVKRPGTYTLSSLSTIVVALMKAGGPSASGSFRDIQLKRGKTVVATFDLYDLLIKGERAADRLIQADDVIHVGPVGPQVALVGAVNKPAIFELKPTDALRDVLAMAGGLGAVADRSRLAVERLADRASNRITELALPDALTQTPSNGDVYKAFSAVDTVLPVARQNKRIRVEGEVLRPGEYVLPASSSISDALKMAGGTTSLAYIFGTEFSRESVRISQQENYDRALRDLETEFAKASTQRALTADEAAAQTARNTASQQLIQKLRSVKPTGRIVLQLPLTGAQLPNLALEDGDRIYIPAQPTSIGVFGSVFNAGSYLFGEAKNIEDFLSLAGGPTRGADASSTFVLRANGSVVSNLQKSSFFGYLGGIKGLAAQPGDTIFVPEEVNKTTWTQSIKEWTQILYQFGLGAAALKAIGY